jgi:hypothetical protein
MSATCQLHTMYLGTMTYTLSDMDANNKPSCRKLGSQYADLRVASKDDAT